MTHTIKKLSRISLFWAVEIAQLEDLSSIPRTHAKWGKKPCMVLRNVGEMETGGFWELAGQPLGACVSPRPARDPVQGWGMGVENKDGRWC